MGPLVILLGAGAAFAGWYLFIRKPAAHGTGTPGATLTSLPGGSPGLANLQVNYVVPGGDYIIATHDTGEQGVLTARQTAGGAPVGAFAHGAVVHYLDGPDGSGKWIKVSGENVSSAYGHPVGQHIEGWVATQYITG